MRETYQKRGRSLRYENGTMVRTSEAGEAVEDGVLFACRPIAAPELPEIDSAALRDAAASIRRLVAHPLSIERLVITEGVAEHRFGDKVWTEHHRRIHLSLTRGSMRAFVDLGDFRVEAVNEVARALTDAGAERDAPQRVRLAPRVSAAVLPLLAGIAPPNVTLLQSGGGIDGKGEPVFERPIEWPPWPNWYRPIYRARPFRAPLNLRARCAVTRIDEDLPRAVALLAPAAGLTLRVLLDDRGRVGPATVRMVRIDGVAEETTWFPYGAGSFGAEMML